MAKLKIKNKKLADKKKKKSTKKTNNVVVKDAEVPVGSVHFDEFLKICREPSKPVEPVVLKPKFKKKNKVKRKNKKNNDTKGAKKKKTDRKVAKPKKGKKSKKLPVVVKSIEAPQTKEKDEAYPPLFPLIKALLLPTEGDALDNDVLFSEFVVGKNDPPLLKNLASMKEVNLIEKQANDTINEIQKVQENIRVSMQKSKLTEAETVESEDQQLLLINLLNDFENCLDRIRDIFHQEQAMNEDDDDQWEVVDEDEDTQKKKQRIKCSAADLINEVESTRNMNVSKWYEGINLAYLLSPNSSFEKEMAHDVSSGVLKLLDELRDPTATPRTNEKLTNVFKRLKEKFCVLLPPPKTNATRKNLIWMDKKLYQDHLAMLEATKNLKIFQCWNQLELKYNIINALIISLKDAIKSTSPFYYAPPATKSRFVSDQSALVLALDDFKRKLGNSFRLAGLDEYWRVHPESIRLGSRPYFDVTIRQRTMEYDKSTPPLPDDRQRTFLQRNPFVTQYNNCKNVVKIVNSEDSEIEVDTFNYNK